MDTCGARSDRSPSSRARDQSLAVPSLEDVATRQPEPPSALTPHTTPEWPAIAARQAPVTQSHTLPRPSSATVTSRPAEEAAHSQGLCGPRPPHPTIP